MGKTQPQTKTQAHLSTMWQCLKISAHINILNDDVCVYAINAMSQMGDDYGLEF